MAKPKRKLFEELKAGIKEVDEHLQGKRTLRTQVRAPKAAPAVTPGEIQTIREACKMSQPVFAGALRINPRTLQAWESGRSVVPDAAAVLLKLVEKYPDTLKRIENVDD